jgi:hypothetical protein
MSGEHEQCGNVTDMRLFNTESGHMEPVSNPGHVGVYVCGITPYRCPHRALDSVPDI